MGMRRVDKDWEWLEGWEKWIGMGDSGAGRGWGVRGWAR